MGAAASQEEIGDGEEPVQAMDMTAEEDKTASKVEEEKSEKREMSARPSGNSLSEFERKRRAAKIQAGPAIKLTSSGFSHVDVNVYEGQIVTFSWSENSGEGFNVVQVIGVDKQNASVPGGYKSGPKTRQGNYSVQFNLAGEFKFISDGFKKKITPLKVTVTARPEYEALITDQGFKMKIITIDEGNWIKFVWKDCQIAHSVTQLEFCDQHCGFAPRKQRGVVPTLNGSYKHEFKAPGLYYFQTQVAMMGESGICVVHVNEVNREYRVEVRDRRFEPMILLIEQGDQVWFSWSQTKDAHCIYQIEPPHPDQASAEEYKPVREGFRWHEPSHTGLLSHQFTEPGVYYYTDRDFSYAAEYMGTIIVKPKQREHFIKVQPNQYLPDVLHAATGDRIWWQWTPIEMEKAFSIKQIEQCLSPSAKDPKDSKCEGTCRAMTEKQMVQFCKTGMQTAVVNSIGLYHYKIPEVVNALPTSTIIVQSGQKNFTVKVDDSGFSPRYLTINPSSRVWFIWQSAEKMHNIQQVSYEGTPVGNGFTSGAARHAPSAFMHQFNTPGVFYFVSKSLPRLFGAIIVSTQPQVHSVAVRGSVKPDPITVMENDVVYWQFNEEKTHDVVQIHNVSQAGNVPQCRITPPRSLMNRAFADDGVFHFTSPSMIDRTRRGSNASIEPEDLRISSVIVDEQKDGHCVRVDNIGFHPRNITIRKGESILWTWKGENEQTHNIINVNPPDSESPLSVVEGRKSFNSGKMVKNNSYMYTFDELGYFCVASQGAPGYAGTVNVVNTGKKVDTPFIDYTEQMGGSVELYHAVELKCTTPEAEIYYTIDGSTPYPWHKSSKQYDPVKGVILKYPTLCFIRACAVHDSMLDSDVFTSRRFAVSDQTESVTTESESAEEEEQIDMELQRMWRICEPRIRAYFLEGEPGEMNVVWDELPEQCIDIVKGYRLFINGVVYCTSFPSSYSTINVSGLAGGHTYEIVLECLPANAAFLPHRSNIVSLRCNEKVETGGPLISLERSDKPNELIVVWRNISTSALPFQGYFVYLNNVQCGSLIIPQRHENRCRAVIRTQEGTRYSVIVAAVPAHEGQHRMSNELCVTLPLDTREIMLPPNDLRSTNTDIYKEYLEVRDGNTDLSSAASDSTAESETASESSGESDDTVTPRPEDASGKAHPAQFETDKKRWGSLKTAVKMSSLAAAALRPKVSTNTGAYQALDISNKIPIANKPERKPSLGTDSVMVMSGEVAETSNSQNQNSETKKTNLGGDTKRANFGKRMSAPGLPVQRVPASSTSLPSRRHSVAQPYNLQSIVQPEARRASVTSLKGVFGLFSDQSPHAIEPVIEEEEPRNLDAFMRSGAGDSDSDSEERMDHVAMESRHIIKFRNVATGIMVWTIFLKQPRLPSKGKFRQAALLVLKFIKLQKHFMPVKSLYSNKSGLKKKATWNKMREFFQGAKALKVIQPVKLKTQLPATIEEEPELPESPHHADVPTPAMQVHPQVISKRRTSIIPEDSAPMSYDGNEQHASTYQTSEPKQFENKQSMSSSAMKMQRLKVSASKLKLKSISNTLPSLRSDVPPSPSYVESLIPSDAHQSNDGYESSEEGSLQPLRVGLNPSQLPVESLDAAEAMKDWLSAQTDVLSSLAGRSHFDGFTSMTPGQILVDVTSPQQSPPKPDQGISKIPVITPAEENLGRVVPPPQRVPVLDHRSPDPPVADTSTHTTAQVEVHATAHDVFPAVIKEKEAIKSIVVPVHDPTVEVLEQETPAAAEQPTSPKSSFVAPPDGYQLPIPVVHIEHIQDGGEIVKWELSDRPDMNYRLTSFAVNVIGERFTTEINSDISFECIVNSEGERVNLLQHVWNVTNDHTCNITGLANGCTYRIYVAANWTFLAGNYPRDTQSRSKAFDYTTVGAPQAPVLKALRTELLNQVTVEWAPSRANSIPVAGYKVLLNGTSDFKINGKPASDALPADCTTTTIDHLAPGRTVKVQIIAITNHPVGDSRPSNTLVVTCPVQPESPLIVNQPSYKKGVVVVAWDAPKPSIVEAPGHPANITYYTVYVDGVWHGEVKANQSSDSHGYQYYLTDLKPGLAYDINVKSISGQKVPEGNAVYCLCESYISNTLPVTCAAPPSSPHIYIEGMTPQGIDITWEVPQQYGDAVLSGYQLLKNGSIYGSTIPPEVTSMSIKDISLGEDIKLQIIALTEHPVGGVDQSKSANSEGRYAECTPGPKLNLQYTGLVTAANKVWSEKVTGHQVMLVWKHKLDRQKAHFLPPDSYQITWWPGEVPEGHINSCSTSGDHLLIQDLKPNTVYTMVVEARRKQHYVALDEMAGGPGEEINRHFIISAKSQKLIVRTGQPPEAPSNLGVLASTCHSLQIGWDPPRERGVEVKSVRVDCIPVHKKIKGHICEELLPTDTVINLHNLCEHTEYDIVITAVTEEYFDSLPGGHDWKKERQIPQHNVIIPDSEWLPKSVITVRTSGTEPPTDLTLTKIGDTEAELSWNPAVVFGNNRLLSYVVRWTRLDPNADKENEHYMEHLNLHKRETCATIKNLIPGFQYRIVAEAVVSVKTAIEAIDGDEEKNRRTTHIPSMPLLVRARAPVQPPTVLVTGYTPQNVNLYWDKPVLCSVVARDAEGSPVYVKRYLEGYRLYINGRLHMRLDNSAQNVTLTKCKPGKTYEVSLVALTSTEAARREKKRGIRAEDDSDESLSNPITVSLPSIHAGNFDNISAKFVEESNKDVGSVHVKWNVQSHHNDIKQWNVIWYERDEGVLHKTGLEPYNKSCIIPIDKRKKIYEISVEPDVYGREIAPPPTQRLQVIIPGSVDAPEIFLKTVNEKDFTIEWGEPRCYGGVRVKGYQLYMNDKKIGRVLSSTHRKAVIPCRANRQYKLCMYAIGSEYGNSAISNSLLINTPGSRFCAGQMLDSSLVDFESWEASDQTDLKVRSSQVTDTSMKIDWVYENKPRGIRAYKVVWSCTTQPRDREVRVETDEAEYSLVLQKLFPGITHYTKVFAIGDSDIIIEKSKQIIVQTSAPPDIPAVGIRACNLKYISIQWEKPKCYGSAHITGYRIYIDGICEAVNGPDQMIFNYTTGKFCNEYSFQVQAITDNDLCSKPSDPLLVKWPGVIPPTVRQLPSDTNSSLKVGWDIPYTTEGIKVKHYKVVCREVGTEKVVQTVSPIHPETTQAELYNVRKGDYQIYLEIYLHGSSDLFRSDAIGVEPFIFPDPPLITVTVVGIEERRQLEKVTGDLINKRYKLMSVLADGGKNEGVISGHKFRRTEIVHAQAKAKEYLMHVDEMLDDCFKSIANYTGVLMLHISWTAAQGSQDINISGYRVLVDGKQFGTTLHSGVNNVRIKLNLESRVHRISMVTVSGQPYGISAESNTVDVLTDPFRPFVAFCYGNIHQQDERWPSPGCCRYDVAIDYERQQTRMKPSYKGLLHKPVAPPRVNVLDVFECEFKPLLPPKGPGRPTILLFWSRWCLASQKMMEYMFKFSQFNNHKYDFISLACGLDVTIPQERADLVHAITSNGWNDNQAMWHVTDQSASTVVAAQNFIKQNLIGADGKRLKQPPNAPQIAFGNTSDLLGLVGVPSIVVIHPSNYIAWMGTFSAFDQGAFDIFIEHTMAECLGFACTVEACIQCQQNSDLFGLLSAKHTEDGLSHQMSIGATNSLIIPAVNDKWVSQAPVRKASAKKSKKQRPQSAKKPATNGLTNGQRNRPMSAASSRSSKSNISITKRPYSASGSAVERNSPPPTGQQPTAVQSSRKKRTIVTG